MRKILLIIVLSNSCSLYTMHNEEAALLPHHIVDAEPHPPSYEQVIASTSSCSPKARWCATMSLGTLWLIATLSQILPGDDLFKPESRAAQCAWWGTAIGSQLLITVIALCGIWRR